ncbi:MAG: hypothetical protein JWM90_179 [Thermoleophilia bacterium]|nr:hypothetical protein [Thermoleophilia bacterium]
MPSHAYFFNTDRVPEWDDPKPAPMMAGSERRRIAGAILAQMPGAAIREGSSMQDRCISMVADGLDVTVHHDYVHVRIPYWDEASLLRKGLPHSLHRLAAVVDEVARFDFFEHGDLGLGVRADIDGVVERVARISDGLMQQIADAGLPLPERGVTLAVGGG